VTRQGILRAEDIFEPNIGLLKGKTTQKHVEIQLQDLPQEIMETHREITLAIDSMFINKIPFIMTTSCNIHFSTAELVKDMKNKTLMPSIEQVLQAYHSQVLKVQAVLADWQFKHIQQSIEEKGITLNICATNKHITEIERYIRTVNKGKGVLPPHCHLRDTHQN